MSSVEITLSLDGASEGVSAEPLGGGLYRLEGSPIVVNWEHDPVYLGDVIEVEPQPDGTHRLVRAVERAAMRHFSWAVPRFFHESTEYARFGEAVEAAGGLWEGAFGGLLWVHLPSTSTFDAEAELSRRISASKAHAGNG